MIKRGDIVKLKYNGNYKTKLLKNIVNSDHPILILSELPNNKIRIATMSSNINSDAVKNLSRNVILTNLKGTGLSKSTYVDTSSTGIIDESNIYKVIGKVSQSDLNNILNEYSKTKQRQVIEAYKVYNTGYPEYLDYYYDDLGNIIFMLLEDVTKHSEETL